MSPVADEIFSDPREKVAEGRLTDKQTHFAPKREWEKLPL